MFLFQKDSEVSVSDDNGQTINAFTQIHVSTGNHDSADADSIIKHEASPAKQSKRNIVHHLQSQLAESDYSNRGIAAGKVGTGAVS